MQAHNGTMLSCRGVSVRFGGVQALSGADLTVSHGVIASLIGPNGAGKTTLLNAVSGLIRIDSGSVLLDGAELTGKPPHERAKAGIVRTFQNLEIFTNMSVIENVMTGMHRNVKYGVMDSLFKTPRYWRNERMCREKAEAELEFVGLADKKLMGADELPFGSLRLLELARALASSPGVLLLDEPAAGLNIKETRRLAGMIRRIRDERRITVVLVEHDMELVMEISDRITVLNYGEVIAEGSPLEVQKNPDVVRIYLGEDE